MRLVSTTSGRGAGFTLIELMVVLVLIAIMSAVIIPELRGTYEDALLRSTARELVGACNLAYSQAVTLNQIHRVRLDQQNGKYFIERTGRGGEEGMGFIPVKDLPGGKGVLDARISIEIRKPEEDPASGVGQEIEPRAVPAEELQRGKGNDAVTFYPDGTADPGEVVLRDREGFRLSLRINPTTARVQVGELQHE